MTRTATALRNRLVPFRRLAAVAGTGLVLGTAAAVFGAVAWLIRLGWAESLWWVIVAWGAGLASLVGLGWLAGQRLARLSPLWLAEELEESAFRRGSIRAHLEPAQPGTSETLLAAADADQAQAIGETGAQTFASLGAAFRFRAARGVGVLLVGGLIIGSSELGGGPAPVLWRPLEAASLLRAPVQLIVSRADVEPGGVVSAAMRAPGHRRAILWSRGPGETWQGRPVSLDSTGSAEELIGPIRGDLFLRLTSGGRASDTVAIRVRLPAFLSELVVTARYASYLGLEDEPVPTNGDTVTVPEGTRLEVRGRSTAPLAGAAWLSGSERRELAADGAGFNGTLDLRQSRTWTLSLSPADGRAVGGDTLRLPIVVVPDSAPAVEVPVPGADTVLPALARVPIVVSAQDDHGIVAMVLEGRRVGRLGQAGALRRDTVALPASRERQVIVPVELDLEDRGLVPGDTLRLRVRVWDNSPRRQEGVSREYALRLATRSELREMSRQSGETLRQRLAEVGEESRRLERRTEDLASEQNRRGAESGAGQGDQLSYQDAKRAEAVAEGQAQLMREAEELRQAVEELQASAEAAGLNDPDFQRRLEEVRDQLARALTPELRERLAELEQALAQLDGDRTRRALEELADAQRQLRDALERSRELFERAALEGDLANLEASVRDLAQEQLEWSGEVARQDSLAAASEEARLAGRADSLAVMLQQAAEAAARGEQEEPVGLERASDALRDAAREMREAGAAAEEGDKATAQQKGRRAADWMAPLGDQVAAEREALQDAWRQEVVDALDRVLADATRLGERQLSIAEELRDDGGNPRLRAEQGAVEDGVKRLLEQMQDVSGKNALVGGQPSVALAAARDAMEDVRESLSSAAPNTREAARRAAEAVDALNAAAHGLVRSRGAVQGAESGTGMAEALQQLNQMAQQQGQLGQQAGNLLPMAGQGGELQEQLRALGARQRSLAERLERMRAGGQVPGAAEMADEARDLARAMEAGRLNRQTVERQERLFRRMLDAGRTLQGEEEDERQERRSETARAAELKLPAGAAVAADGGGERRMPSWEELRALTPEERRRAVEYFRRLGDLPREGGD